MTLNMNNNYSLHYYIPWPDCQKYEEMEGFEDHSVFDINSYAYFVEQEWLDNLK